MFGSFDPALPQTPAFGNLPLKFSTIQEFAAGGHVLIAQFLELPSESGNALPLAMAIPGCSAFSVTFSHSPILALTGPYPKPKYRMVASPFGINARLTTRAGSSKLLSLHSHSRGSRGVPTYFPSAGQVPKKWYVLDAEGQVLGRLAARVARILMGKHKPQYTPFLDTGDHVVVINAAKVRLTGHKLEKKIYRHHTGYPGGLVERSARRVKEARPDRMIEDAIKGMLPKTRLGKAMARKLRVYAGARHPHQAQKPETVSL